MGKSIALLLFLSVRLTTDQSTSASRGTLHVGRPKPDKLRKNKQTNKQGGEVSKCCINTKVRVMVDWWLSWQEVCLIACLTGISLWIRRDEWKAFNSLLVSSHLNKWSSCSAATVEGCGCSRKCGKPHEWMPVRESCWIWQCSRLDSFFPYACFAIACLWVVVPWVLPIMGLSLVDGCVCFYSCHSSDELPFPDCTLSHT